MFYLTTHSTHFIYDYMASNIWQTTIQIAREETRCRHMGYSFRLAARVILHASSHRQDYTDRITHITAFVTPVVEHWLERYIAQWVHHEGSIRRPIAPWVNTLTTELHLAPSSSRVKKSLETLFEYVFCGCSSTYYKNDYRTSRGRINKI